MLFPFVMRTGLQIFLPEVELALRVLAGATLVSLVLLPIAWGYEQQRRAEAWQQVACTYRLRELGRRAPFVAAPARGRDACATLDRLGFGVDDAMSVTLTGGRR